MLKLFEVTGFKNFHQKITLDFSDVRDYRFNEHCVKDGFLKNVIIYGKNSSGKSNFSLALFDIAVHLAGKSYFPELFNNYLNTTYLGSEADFRYVFQFGTDIVDYIYRKSTINKLTYEKLLLNNSLIVSKNYDGSTKDDLSGLQALAPTLDFSFFKQGSILKYAISNAAITKEHPLYSMMHYVSFMQWDKAAEIDNGLNVSVVMLNSFFVNDADKLMELQELLSAAGVRDTIHVVKDADGVKRLYSAPEYHSSGRIPFFQAISSGTASLVMLFFAYKHKQLEQTPSLLIIDEFDAYFHFELAETIVKLLSKLPNTQVVLTSHNTNLLTNRIMRPDCYFILTPEKLTSFANATPRELREGHNLEKLYMSGEFNV